MNSKYIIGTYYPEWNVYSRQFLPTDIPCKKLTHVFYAFARPSEQGQLVFSDVFSKNILKKVRKKDDINGLCGEMMDLKKQYRHIKVILSIGGGSGSKFFGIVCTNDERRNIFVNNIFAAVTNYGFDGIDIDWEYPRDDLEATSLCTLINDIRLRLDKIHISVAINPLPYYVFIIKPERFISNIDYLMLMCYDFSGPWSKNTRHQCNLFSTPVCDKSIEACIKLLTDKGIPSNKLLMGCPLYGRAFANSEGLNGGYNGSCKGTWEDNVFDYNKIVDTNEKYDDEHGATYSYDENKRIFITYDSPKSIQEKVNFIKNKKMGGIVTWSINSDYPSGHPRSLHDIIYNSLTRFPSSIDLSDNKICYSESIYPNIKNLKI